MQHHLERFPTERNYAGALEIIKYRIIIIPLVATRLIQCCTS